MEGLRTYSWEGEGEDVGGNIKVGKSFFDHNRIFFGFRREDQYKIQEIRRLSSETHNYFELDTASASSKKLERTKLAAASSNHARGTPPWSTPSSPVNLPIFQHLARVTRCITLDTFVYSPAMWVVSWF